MVDLASWTESRSGTSHRTSLAQSGDCFAICPASECTGVVTRVESEAGREKREGASKVEEKEVVELLDFIIGVVVERTAGAMIELHGEVLGV